MLKYITIGLLLIFTSTFCGCNLDTDDDDKLPGDKFWYGEKANAEAFMLSIYQHFRKATTDNGFFLYAGDIRCAPILDQNANNYLYLLQNDMRSYKDKKDGSNKGESSDFGAIYNWKNMYKVVQSANIMIQEIANIQGITDVERERYRAECRFMRSLAYFFMVRLFGDVPYYTEAFFAQPLPRTDKSVVLKNCLADLQSVLDSDPEGNILRWRNGNGSLRANRGAVLTLMMHINMWLVFFEPDNAQTYYEEVKRLAESDSWVDGTYYSLQPMSQMGDVFKGDSNEGLFEIAQNITTGEIFKTDHMWCTKVVYEVRNKTKPDFRYSEVFLQKLYPQETEDGRKSSWFKNLYFSDEENPGSSSSDTYVEIVKMLNADHYGSTLIPNSGNYIVFRLADAILLYAEALNKLGEADKALEEVNRIRQRAGAPDFEAGTDLDADIYWERVRELMGEGQYFYDLVRTEKITDSSFSTFADESGYRETTANLKQGAWTWPIFKGALDNNPYMTKNTYWE
jgi:SusD family.